MSEMPSADHSLRTEIETDFSKSLDSIKQYTEAIESINKQFGSLSTSFDGFETKIGDSLVKAAGEIKNSDLRVGGAKLLANIQRAISNAIGEMEVILNDGKGNLLHETPIKVKISKADWDRMVKKTQEEIAKALLPTKMVEVKVPEESSSAQTDAKVKAAVQERVARIGDEVTRAENEFIRKLFTDVGNYDLTKFSDLDVGSGKREIFNQLIQGTAIENNKQAVMARDSVVKSFAMFMKLDGDAIAKLSTIEGGEKAIEQINKNMQKLTHDIFDKYAESIRKTILTASTGDAITPPVNTLKDVLGDNVYKEVAERYKHAFTAMSEAYLTGNEKRYESALKSMNDNGLDVNISDSLTDAFDNRMKAFNKAVSKKVSKTVTDKPGNEYIREIDFDSLIDFSKVFKNKVKLPADVVTEFANRTRANIIKSIDDNLEVDFSELKDFKVKLSPEDLNEFAVAVKQAYTKFLTEVDIDFTKVALSDNEIQSVVTSHVKQLIQNMASITNTVGTNMNKHVTDSLDAAKKGFAGSYDTLAIAFKQAVIDFQARFQESLTKQVGGGKSGGEPVKVDMDKYVLKLKEHVVETLTETLSSSVTFAKGEGVKELGAIKLPEGFYKNVNTFLSKAIKQQAMLATKSLQLDGVTDAYINDLTLKAKDGLDQLTLVMGQTIQAMLFKVAIEAKNAGSIGDAEKLIKEASSMAEQILNGVANDLEGLVKEVHILPATIQKLEKALENEINRAAASAKIKPAAKGAMKLDLEVDKLADKIADAVKDAVKDYFPDVAEPTKVMKAGADTAVILYANKVKDTLIEAFSNFDISDEYITGVSDRLSKSTKGIIDSVADLSERLALVEKSVRSEITSAVEQVSSRKAGNELDLEKSCQKAIKAVEKEIKQVLASWKPSTEDDAAEFSAKMDKSLGILVSKMEVAVKKVFTGYKPNLEGAVDSAKLNKVAEDIRDRVIKEVSNSIDPTKIVGEVDSYLTASGGVFLPADIKNKLALFPNELLTELVGKVVNPILRELKKDIILSTPQITEADIHPVSEKLNKVFATMTRSFTKKYVDSINAVNYEPSVNTADIHKSIRKEYAKQAGMSLKDWNKQNPTITGQANMSDLLHKNMQLILDRFSDTLNKAHKDYVTRYSDTMKQVEFRPDVTPVYTFQQKMNDMQQEVVRKIKELLQVQFKAVTDEIKSMAITPVSIGYKPTQAFQQAAQSAPVRQQRQQSMGVSQYARQPMSSYDQSRMYRQQNPGGDTRSWMGSVVNTMRYMTAGSLMYLPYMMFNKSIDAYRTVEYDLEKARQNFTMKDPSMKSVAQQVVEDRNAAEGKTMTSVEMKTAIDKETKRILGFMGDGIETAVQDIAMVYSQKLADVSFAYNVASRKMDNPYEALAFTKQVAKIQASEEIDAETSAMGLQAISNQWGVTGDKNLNQATNMLIKTANITTSSVQDLIQTQQRTGAIFRGALEGSMDKDRAMASSLVLSSLFNESTAQTGREGGTFWRTVLTKPYSKNTLDYLSEYSRENNAPDVNPYNEDGSQKDVVTLLGGIFDAVSNTNDKAGNELLSRVFEVRQMGGAEAISAYINDAKANMLEQGKKTGVLPADATIDDVKFTDVLNKLIDNIENVDDEEVLGYIAGMQNTMEMTQQRLATAMESAGYQLVAEFKDEYMEVASRLITLADVIRDNSGAISEVAKGLLSVGEYLMLAKGKEILVDKYSQMSKNLERKPLIADAAMISNRKAHIESKVGTPLTYMGDVADAVSQKKMYLDSKHGELASAQNMLSQYQQANDTNNIVRITDEINKLNKDIGTHTKLVTNMQGAYDGMNKYLAPYVDELNRLAVAESVVNGKLAELDGRVVETPKHVKTLDINMENLRNRLAETGMFTADLVNGLIAMENSVKKGEFRYNNFQREMTEVANALNMTDMEVKMLAKDLEIASGAFAQATTMAKSYDVEMQKLRASQASAKTGMAQAGLPNGYNAGAVSMGALSGVPMAGALSQIATSSKSVVSNLGKLAPAAGNVVGQFAIMYASMEAFNAVFGALIDSAKSKAEKDKSKVDNEGTLVDSASSIVDMSELEYSTTGGLFADIRNLFNQVISVPKWIAGTSISPWAQQDIYMQAEASRRKGESAEEFKQRMLGEEGLGISKRKVKAEIAVQQERLHAIDPYLNSSGTGLNSNLKKGEIYITAEETENLISYLMEDFNKSLEEINITSELEKIDMRLSKGLREDSTEIALETLETIKEQNKLTEQTLAELRERRKNTNNASSGALELFDRNIDELELKLKKGKLEEAMMGNSLMDTVTGEYDRKGELADAEYDIKKYNTIANGTPADSMKIKLMDKGNAQAKVARIEAEQQELQKLMSSQTNKEVRENMWLEIQKLEAEQAKLMADIRDILKTGTGTFNLPSGMKPMTYWEYMGKNATHKNVTARSGDVIVNVNVDKMTAGTMQEANEIGKILGDIVKKNLVTDFNSQVLQGVQNRYYTDLY